MSDENYNEDAMREIEESLRRDQEENKNLPDRLVIDGLEFTNIRVRDIQLEPKLEDDEEPEPRLTENDSDSDQQPQVQTRDTKSEQDRHDEIMKEIEESLRRDQEENKNLPEKVVIDGLEFSNIRVRDIQLEPKFEDNEEPEPRLTENDSDSDQQPQVQTRDTKSDQDRHDEVMKEIEESLRRDQEENKKLPEKVVIDGLEFSNIRVREISLEPKFEDNEEPEHESVPKQEPKPEPEPVQPTIKARSLTNINLNPKQEGTTAEIKSPSNLLGSTKSPASETTKSTPKQLSSERKTTSLKQENNQPQTKTASTSQSSSYSKFLIISAALIIVSFVISRFFKKS